IPHAHPPLPFARRGERTGGEWGKRPAGATLGGNPYPLAACGDTAQWNFAGTGPPKVTWGPGRAKTYTPPSANRCAIRHERREVFRAPGVTVAGSRPGRVCHRLFNACGPRGTGGQVADFKRHWGPSLFQAFVQWIDLTVIL